MKDIKYKWWEVPFEKLTNCSMAQCYLNAKGVELYLPAYMTGVIENPSRRNYSDLISWIKPRENLALQNKY
jgi:hypothetical protein